MFVAAHEWTPPREPAARAPAPNCPAPARPIPLAPENGTRQFYERLASGLPDPTAPAEARGFLQQALRQAQGQPCDLPESPHDLPAWMRNAAQLASAQYRAYLAERQAGAPRRYFSNRAHALHFLRAVAPTKLVDGAWLYGLLAHGRNPRLADLIATYVEELGEGRADKNHVLLYRRLLERHGIHPAEPLAERFYTQGLLQLALGLQGEDFLPEVIGFNLAYEQLPLHLLITAYELNELGIDPYYFTLHVTVDNADTGHAQRAVQAVLDTLPRIGDGGDFWRRVRNGSRLGNAGLGTTEVIAGFDIGREVEALLSRKSRTGQGAHSDYCRVAGRSVNDWLALADGMPAFLAALAQVGWIERGAPVRDSRFWRLLQGEKAEMFGVFSPYELQLIHDWIRGPASADGQAYDEAPLAAGRRRATHRAQARMAQAQTAAAPQEPAPVLDADLQALQAQLQASAADPAQKERLLVRAMAPSMHWTPAGLFATRQFLASGA